MTNRALLTEQLARQFAAYLTAMLKEHEMIEVIKRNRADPLYQKGFCCHSHDFLDANDVMASAFLTTVGRPYDAAAEWASEGPDTALLNAAWKLAHDHEFWVGVPR